MARGFFNQVEANGVPGTGFWNGSSTLKQYFVFPKNESKYYLKQTFLAFPVLGILGLGTPLVEAHINVRKIQAVHLGIKSFLPKASGTHIT